MPGLRWMVLALALMLPQAAQARSLALVVGNDGYQRIAPLTTARADARAYAVLFRGFGFETTLVEDAASAAMTEALAAFYDSIGPGDTVVFAYAGHGWSDGQRNYLVPTDIRPEGSPTLLAQLSVPLRNGASGILDQIAAREPALTVAIIDACRNNPFVVTGRRAFGLGRGLVQEVPASGSFVAFSAGEGQTALDRLSEDDPDGNSVFTRFFLAELARPQDLQTAFKATQTQVYEAAASVGHLQRPAYYDEVIGSACLGGRCDGEAGSPDLGAAAEWQDFRDSSSVEALRLFAARHPGTAYAALAEERIALLAQPEPPPPIPEPPAAPAEPPAAAESEPAAAPEPAVPPLAGTYAGDCSGTVGQTKFVCEDRALGTLDYNVWHSYDQRLAAANLVERSELQAAQSAFVRAREACGLDRACLGNLYRVRLDALLSPRTLPAACAGLEGQRAVICADMSLRLLDAQVAGSYAEALRFAEGYTESALRVGQVRFEMRRGDCGEDRACLGNLYRSYMSEVLYQANAGLSRRERVRLSQRELIRIGCYAGPADGIDGPATRAGLDHAVQLAQATVFSAADTAAVLALLKRQPDTLCR